MRISPLLALVIGLVTLLCAPHLYAEARSNQALPWMTAVAKAPRVEFRTFESKVVGAKVSYHVFTPEAYDKDNAKFPVVYWLHGTDGGILGIPPLAKYFHGEMQAGRMPPMIVVFVNGLPRRLWADSKNGAAPVETVFIAELIPDVDKNLRTIPSREGRILDGFSMGGYGAARLGFLHPELFAGISILAGGPLDLDLQGPRAKNNLPLREFILREVCDNDAAYFKALSPLTIAAKASDKLNAQRMMIRLAVGEKDDSRSLNRQFHDHLTTLKIAHDYTELPNVDHNALAIFAALGEKNGAFYRTALGQQNSSSH